MDCTDSKRYNAAPAKRVSFMCSIRLNPPLQLPLRLLFVLLAKMALEDTVQFANDHSGDSATIADCFGQTQSVSYRAQFKAQPGHVLTEIGSAVRFGVLSSSCEQAQSHADGCWR